MKITRTLKTLALTAAAGAVASYLLDPRSGQVRRERLAGAAERRRKDLDHLKSSVGRVADAVTPKDSESAEDTSGPIEAEFDADVGERHVSVEAGVAIP